MDLQAYCQKLATEASEAILSGDITEEVFRETERKLEEVLTLDRNNAGILFLLGSLYMRARRFAMCEHWLRRSLQINPEFAEAYNNLGFILGQEGRREEARIAFEQALRHKPECPEVLNNLATQYVNAGSPQRAIDYCNQALAIQPSNNDARWNRGLAYLELGEWEKGWNDYEAGLELDTKTSSQHRKLRVYGEPDLPYWDGTPGKSVIIYGEQGVGDEIMAYSMLPDALRDSKRLVLETHPRLVSLAREAFDGAFPIYGTRKTQPTPPGLVDLYGLDAKCPILSLGKFYRRSADAFPKKPYMKALPRWSEVARKSLTLLPPGRLNVGLSWKGGTNETRSDLRSIPLMQLAEFMGGLDVNWISLQYDAADAIGHNEAIVRQFSQNTGIPFYHNTAVINDLDMCYGGLIHGLDLVISVCTSLVHACGAMGVECWTITPAAPAWRYGLQGREMPWYGSHVRLYRQRLPDGGRAECASWDHVLEEVRRDLEARIAAKMEKCA